MRFTRLQREAAALQDFERANVRFGSFTTEAAKGARLLMSGSPQKRT
jgi:hypothetical protein